MEDKEAIYDEQIAPLMTLACTVGLELDLLRRKNMTFDLEKMAVDYCAQYGISEDDQRRGDIINAFCVGAKIEREACAKLCEDNCAGYSYGRETQGPCLTEFPKGGGGRHDGMTYAAAIRARSNLEFSGSGAEANEKPKAGVPLSAGTEG